MLNWDYWLNSGEWLPWAIRASIVTVLFLFAVNPGWGLWIKRKLNPVWPDGTPMGLGFAWSWWRAGWKGKIRREGKEKKSNKVVFAGYSSIENSSSSDTEVPEDEDDVPF